MADAFEEFFRASNWRGDSDESSERFTAARTNYRPDPQQVAPQDTGMVDPAGPDTDMPTPAEPAPRPAAPSRGRAAAPSDPFEAYFAAGPDGLRPPSESGFWGDMRRGVVGGALSTLGSVAAAGEYVAGSGGVMSAARRGLERAAQGQFEGASEGFRTAMEREFLPGGEGPSAYDSMGSFLGAIGAQTVTSLPSMLLSIVPAGLAARMVVGAGGSMARAATVAGAVTGSMTGTQIGGATWQAISDAWRTAPDSEVRESPLYRQFYESAQGTHEERDRLARELAARETRPYAPIFAGAIGATAGALLQGPLAARLGAGQLGFLQGMRQGAVAEAAEEGIQGVAQEGFTQEALNAGLGRPIDPMEIARQGIQGAVVGGAVGGAVGGVGGLVRSPSTLRQSGVDPDVDAAARRSQTPDTSPPVAGGTPPTPPPGTPAQGAANGASQGVSPEVAAATAAATQSSLPPTPVTSDPNAPPTPPVSETRGPDRGVAMNQFRVYNMVRHIENQRGTMMPAAERDAFEEAWEEAAARDASDDEMRAIVEHFKEPGTTTPPGVAPPAPAPEAPPSAVQSAMASPAPVSTPSADPWAFKPSHMMRMSDGNFIPVMEVHSPSEFEVLVVTEDGTRYRTSGSDLLRPNEVPPPVAAPQPATADEGAPAPPSSVESETTTASGSGATPLPASEAAPDDSPATSESFREKHREAELFPMDADRREDATVRVGSRDIEAALKVSDEGASQEVNNAAINAREKLVLQIAYMRKEAARKNLIKRIMRAWEKAQGNKPLPAFVQEASEIRGRGVEAKWQAWRAKWVANELDSAESRRREQPLVIMKRRNALMDIFAENPASDAEIRGDVNARRQRIARIEQAMQETLGTSEANVLMRLLEIEGGDNAFVAMLRLLEIAKTNAQFNRSNKKLREIYDAVTAWDYGMRGRNGGINEQAAIDALREMRAESEMQSQRNVSLTQGDERETDVSDTAGMGRAGMFGERENVGVDGGAIVEDTSDAREAETEITTASQRGQDYNADEAEGTLRVEGSGDSEESADFDMTAEDAEALGAEGVKRVLEARRRFEERNAVRERPKVEVAADAVSAPKAADISKVLVAKPGTREARKVRVRLTANPTDVQASLARMREMLGKASEGKGVSTNGADPDADRVHDVLMEAMDRARDVGLASDSKFKRIFFKPRAGARGVFDRALMRALENTVADSAVIVIVRDADWRKAFGKDASKVDGWTVTDNAVAAETGMSGTIFMPERLTKPAQADRAHETFLHELVHAATEYSVWRNPKVRAEVRAMMNAVETWIDNQDSDLQADLRADPNIEYGLRDEAEFVAMAMSNRDFQTLLENIRLGPAERARLGLTGQAPGLFAKFVDMVRRLLSLGPRHMTMLEGVIEKISPRLATGEQNRALAAESLGLDSDQATFAHALVNMGNIDSMSDMVHRFAKNRSTNFIDRLKSWGPALATMRQIEMLTKDWWSRTDTMNAFNPNERFNPVEVVSRAILSQSQQAENILTKEFNPTLSKLADRPEASQQAIAGLGIDSSMANLHPDVPLTHAKNAHIMRSTSDSARQARARHADLHARFKALDPVDRALFLEIGEMTRKGHENLIKSIIDMTLDRWWEVRAKLANDPKNPTPLPMTRAEYDAMKARFLNGSESQADQKAIMEPDEDTLKFVLIARERGKLEGYYVPLRRHGQFVVRWQTRDDPVLEFDTSQELNNAVGSATENVKPGSRRRITYDAQGNEVTKPDKAVLQVEVQNALNRLPVTASQKDKDEAARRAERDALDITKELAVKNGGKVRYRAELVTQGLSFFDTIAEAQESYEALKEQGVPGLKQIDLRDTSVSITGMIEPEIERLMHKALRDDSMSEATRAATTNALQKALLVLTPNRAVEGAQIKRKGAQGASRDIGRFLSEYATANANYIAANIHQHTIQRGLAAMEQNVRAETTNDSSPKGRVVAMRRILDELRIRSQRDALDSMMTGDGLLERIMRSVQSIAFLYYLVSPAYAMIQLLQPYLLSAPVLSGKFGVRGTTELGKAMSDIGMGKVLRGGAKEAGRALKTFVDNRGVGQSADLYDIARANLASGADYKGVTAADTVRMLDELQLEGLVGNSSGLEVIRTLKAREGFLGTNLAKAEAFGRAIPGAIEVINRTGTAVAAYRLARTQRDPKLGRPMTHEEATDYARVVVDQTQADYSAANTSRFMRPSNLALRAITSPMMTFRKYAQAIYALLGAQVYAALKGADKQTRKDARRVLLGIMAAHISMAGALGLPTEGIFIALGAVAFALGEDEPWDLETEARKLASDIMGPEAAELFMRGLPRALGMDLSSRVGLNSLLFMKDLQDYQGRTFTGYVGDFVLGAPGGIVQKWASVPGHIANDDWGKALEAALPKGIADVLKATRINEEGITTRRGERIDSNREVPMSETLMQALGITPAATAEIYERRNAVQGANRRLTTERNDLLRKWRQATPGERTRIWREEIMPWNDNVPTDLRTARITMQNLQASLREATRRARESGGEDYLPRNRAALREEGRFAVVPQ